METTGTNLEVELLQRNTSTTATLVIGFKPELMEIRSGGTAGSPIKQLPVG
jgi:hypothetical protein